MLFCGFVSVEKSPNRVVVLSSRIYGMEWNGGRCGRDCQTNGECTLVIKLRRARAAIHKLTFSSHFPSERALAENSQGTNRLLAANLELVDKLIRSTDQPTDLRELPVS